MVKHERGSLSICSSSLSLAARRRQLRPRFKVKIHLGILSAHIGAPTASVPIGYNVTIKPRTNQNLDDNFDNLFWIALSCELPREIGIHCRRNRRHRDILSLVHAVPRRGAGMEHSMARPPPPRRECMFLPSFPSVKTGDRFAHTSSLLGR